MIWTFPRNLGGQESGFHDAGVETFKGNLERYLAREIIQNSLDARDDAKKPVLVRFELLELGASDVPDLKTLVSTFRRCADYWEKDPKATEFFNSAEKLGKSKKIFALRAGDFNTKGVTGSDTDRENGWYTLIRCSGASSKWAGEGGSFGIGKNAPFAASRMRAVLYSTMTKDKEYAFQGVAKLVSHEHPKDGIAQHIGYLGDKNGSSIREKKQIPDVFCRSKPGTDLIILGYNNEGSWKQDLVHSVLENFWPAIHFGDLEVEVDGTRINGGSLKKLLSQFSTEPEFTAHLYYQAFTDAGAKRFEESLPSLKKVEVRLLAGEQGLPKRVAMVRKTGMIIYHQHFKSLVPYCGVFLCRNNEGNRLLREMEPPRHDDWDPNHPEKNANRRTYLEFHGYIKNCVNKLAPASTEKVLSIPELSQYLPDDDDATDDAFSGADERQSKQESFDRKPEAIKITARKMDRSRRSMQPDEARPGDGELDTEDIGDGFGTGGGPGKGANNVDGGSGSGGGGTGQGSAGPKKGSQQGNNAKPAIPVRGRVFVKDLPNGIYSAIVEPLKAVKGDVLLTLKAIGDDSTATVVRVVAAKAKGGGDLQIPRPGVLGPVKFSGRNRVIIDVTLEEPRKLAMEVEAHEVE